MKTSRTLAVLLVLVVAGGTVLRAEEPPPGEWAKRLDAKAKSIVFIKYVVQVRTNFQGRTSDREQKGEVLGVVVNDTGLVLTANSTFDPSGMFPPGMRAQVEMTATPTTMKVLFENEADEYEARLVARDSSLGLAFVQILDLKGRKVSPVDLSTSGKVTIGQEIYGVSRLVRGFDCAPILAKATIVGKVEKPRPMWVPMGNLPGIGLPVFGDDGAAIGVVVNQQGASDERRVQRRNFVLPLGKQLTRILNSAAERGVEAIEAAAEEAAEDKAEEGEQKPEGGEEEKGSESGGDK